MNKILTFTDSAADYIQGMLLQGKGLGFRISIKKTGCSGYKYEPSIISQEVPGDLHCVVKDDLKVYIDPLCVELLTGLTVDLIEEKKEGSLKQKKLTFINPKEKSRCGCGESFHV